MRKKLLLASVIVVLVVLISFFLAQYFRGNLIRPSTRGNLASSTSSVALWPASIIENAPFPSCPLKNGYCEKKDAKGAVAYSSRLLASARGDMNRGGAEDVILVLQNKYKNSNLHWEIFMLSQDGKDKKLSLFQLTSSTAPNGGEFYGLNLNPGNREVDIDVLYPKTEKNPSRIHTMHFFMNDEGTALVYKRQ